MILAGDIGGTNSRMALFSQDRGGLRLAAQKKYPSQQHKSLEEIVQLFLSETGARVETACCGIAGPVVRGRAVASNLPWIADAAEVSRQTGIAPVFLINDLQAHASGIDDLDGGDLVALNSAQAGEGNAALIAAGTGLGEAGMYWDGSRRHAFASEGGHADFAPGNNLEAQLHAYLMQKFKHVSCERVLSGPGLKNIYDFLRDTGIEVEPDWLRTEINASPNPAAIISQYGLEGRDGICTRALDVLVGAYGSEAGNLALRMLATGGVFISGGIAPKILPKLLSPIFLDAFTEKGRMKPLLESMPIKVIVNDKVGLIGAARYAVTRQELSTMERPQKPELKVVPDPDALYRAAADEFVRCAQQAVKERGRFCVALSGGNTPRGVNSLLAASAKQSLAWDKIYIFFGDERHVPADDPESNYRMTNETLLSRVPIPAANVFRIQAELAADVAAQQYENQLRKFFRLSDSACPHFDLIFLGLGDDGHTASLFPGSPALRENERLVVANWVEKFKTYRITFTYPVLNYAEEVVFLVSGEGKSQILREILGGAGDITYPAQLVRPQSGCLLWMVDQAAAQLL